MAIVVAHERLSCPEWAKLSVTNRRAPRSMQMEQGPMTDSERDHLRAELEHDKALITQSRKLIARNRASIADAEMHFADSFDRLAESQKLARPTGPQHSSRWGTFPAGGRLTIIAPALALS